MPQINASGLHLIESFEGCRLKAYWDGIGEVWTIGYGHAGPVNGQPLQSGVIITPEQASQLLQADLRQFESSVNDAVSRNLTSNQFSALVSFAFNVGVTAFEDSTLLKLVNAGDFTGAAQQFGRWVHGANGQTVPGLVRRRAAEAALFEEGAV